MAGCITGCIFGARAKRWCITFNLTRLLCNITRHTHTLGRWDSGKAPLPLQNVAYELLWAPCTHFAFGYILWQRNLLVPLSAIYLPASRKLSQLFVGKCSPWLQVASSWLQAARCTLQSWPESPSFGPFMSDLPTGFVGHHRIVARSNLAVAELQTYFQVHNSWFRPHYFHVISWAAVRQPPLPYLPANWLQGIWN